MELNKAPDSIAEESPSSINVSLKIRKSVGLRPLHVSIRIIFDLGAPGHRIGFPIGSHSREQTQGTSIHCAVVRLLY